MLDIKTIKDALQGEVLTAVQAETKLGYATIHGIASGKVTDPHYTTAKRLSEWVYRNKAEWLEAYSGE